MLISDNQASKLAFKLGKALLQPRDELQLVTVVLGEESVPYGSGLLAPYLPSAQQQQQQQQHGPAINPVVRCADQQHAKQQQGPTPGQAAVDSSSVLQAQVLLKGENRLADVISQYCKDAGADLLVTGSQNLCVDGECRGDHQLNHRSVR